MKVEVRRVKAVNQSGKLNKVVCPHINERLPVWTPLKLRVVVGLEVTPLCCLTSLKSLLATKLWKLTSRMQKNSSLCSLWWTISFALKNDLAFMYCFFLGLSQHLRCPALNHILYALVWAALSSGVQPGLRCFWKIFEGMFSRAVACRMLTIASKWLSIRSGCFYNLSSGSGRWINDNCDSTWAVYS